MEHCLVIIARDRPELWLTWASFYGGAETVEIVFDRRQRQPWPRNGHQPDRRTQSRHDTSLRDQGFIVIPRPEIVSASH